METKIIKILFHISRQAYFNRDETGKWITIKHSDGGQASLVFTLICDHTVTISNN